MSDQDFFFDEDETAEDAASEKPARKQAAPRPQTRSAGAAPAVQSVSVTVAALIGVVALLAGIIVGILIPRRQHRSRGDLERDACGQRTAAH